MDLRAVNPTHAPAGGLRAELETCIAALDAGVDELPTAAIRWAQEHRDLVVPRLIEQIRTATARARAGDAPKARPTSSPCSC